MKSIRIVRGMMPITVDGVLTLYGPGDEVKGAALATIGEERVTELIAEGVAELAGGNGEIKNAIPPAEKTAIVEIAQGLINRSTKLYDLAERARLAQDPATVAPREPLVAPSGSQARR